MSVEIEELEDDIPQDFRRANGAPMVMIDGKNERFSRPSGWGKDLDDENALVNWKVFVAMAGVAQSKALQAKVIACKDDDKKEKNVLREEAIQTGRGNEASDTGTALHAMSCRYEDPEDDFQPPDEYLDDLVAYITELERLGLESVLFEYQVCNVTYRAAGTCDRLYRLSRDLPVPDGSILPAGTLIVGDLKTGKKLDFSLPGYSVQLAIYALGEMYDVVKDEIMPTPDVNKKWGLLVHLPVGKATCEMRWVDLEVGAWGAYLTQQVRQWRKNWKNGEFDAPLAESDPTAEQVTEALGATEVSPETDPAGWLEAMHVFAQARIQTIGKHVKARTALMQRWPADVPTVKQGIEDTRQMTQILDLLDKIEREFLLPFPEDPRVQQGVHKDAMSATTNTPTKDES